MTRYYPISLSLKNKLCLVIGAGTVAERKVRRLIEFGAYVLVVSPIISAGLRALSRRKKITFRQRRATLRDLKGAFLVVAATADRKTNALISTYCQKRNILINVVDSPKECNFIVPSIVKRGNLTIAISTDGISPALAKKIRKELEKIFGNEYADFLSIMKELRPRIISKITNMHSRKVFFENVLHSNVLKLIKQNKQKQAKNILECMLESFSN